MLRRYTAHELSETILVVVRQKSAEAFGMQHGSFTKRLTRGTPCCYNQIPSVIKSMAPPARFCFGSLAPDALAWAWSKSVYENWTRLRNGCCVVAVAFSALVRLAQRTTTTKGLKRSTDSGASCQLSRGTNAASGLPVEAVDEVRLHSLYRDETCRQSFDQVYFVTDLRV